MSDTPLLPFAVVLNRSAGRGLAAREWPRLEAELRARGMAYELLETTSGADALARVRALPPQQPVMVVGGEGTTGALMPSLVEQHRPLAIVPLGSGNDFAGMLGLRPGDFGEALARLSYAPRQVDALDVRVIRGDLAGTRRWLLNGLGLGFDAQVNAAMLDAPPSLPGFWRYTWGAAASVRALRLTGLEVVLDGETVYRGRSCLCSVMNSTRFGGGFHISPLSDARDGRLNAVWSGPVNRLTLVGLMLRVLPGRHLGHPAAHHGMAQRVTVRWDSPVHLHLDGDACGKASEVQVQVLPGAVTLLSG